MAVRRTFQTEAERAAYLTGYHDAINAANVVLVGAAAIADAKGHEEGAIYCRGVKKALEEHDEGVP